MDQRRELLTQLLSRAEVRELFPDSLDRSGKIVDPELFRILERMWTVVRKGTDSDEECAENIEMVLRITAALADSGYFN